MKIPGKIKIAILLGLFLLSFTSSYALVQPRGTDETFDILTWNIHEFPGTGFRTIDTLAVLVNDLDVDMIAFQEVADTNAFIQLMGLLPGWDGIYSTDDYGNGTYQKTAVIWRTDRASVTYIEALFEDYWYQFPRPPMHIYGEVDFNDRHFDFHLIIMHLKAGSTNDDWLRRRAAVIMLKSYLDNNVPGSDDLDWIVLGDWNDEIDEPESSNIFWPLLEDSTDYTFLTLPLAGNPYWASYPSWNSLIDHIMVTDDALSEYGNGNTITLRLDDEYSNYAYRISDHRPVMSQFLGETVGLIEKDNPPSRFSLLKTYPNPFNGEVNLMFSIFEAGEISIEIYDLLGRRIDLIVNDYSIPGDYNVRVDSKNWSSGVYFVRLTGSGFVQTTKMVLLK